MAKHTELQTSAPLTHISWPKEGIKLSGDYKALGLDKKARFILEGIVKGFSMREYGCEVDIKLRTVRVDGVGAEEKDEDGPSMADVMREMKSKQKKGNA